MPLSAAKKLLLFSKAETYAQKVARLLGSSMVAYWPDPHTGLDVSGHGYNGTPTAVAAGVAIAGSPSGSFDGSTSVLNIYSAGLAGAFNPAAGMVCGFAQVSGAGIWTDAANRQMVELEVNANNLVRIGRSSVNNQLLFRYRANSISISVLSTALAGTLAVFHWAITWNTAADEMKAYLNGVQVGTTQTALPVWAGALASTATTIGAVNTAAGSPFSGLEGHVILTNTVPSDAVILQLASF
jgi:hypothetical protein